MKSTWTETQRRALVAAVLFAATLATYAGVRHHEFVYLDDILMVVDNPNLTRPATPAALLRHFWTPFHGNWLPLYWISLHLDHALYGPDNAAAFLLTNVLIHALATVALFAALSRMTRSPACSAFVAAVFALHPLHVESVAWVTERKDVLAGLFWMLGLCAYARYVEAPHSVGRYLTLTLCLVLGLLSKALGVTFPFALLLLDFWPLDRLRGAFRDRVREKLPLFAIVAVFAAVTYATQQRGGNTQLGDQLGLATRLLNVVESYWMHLRDAAWPTGLAAIYPHPYALSPPTASDRLLGLGLGFGLLFWTGVALAAARRAPYLVVGWLWYLGTLVPTIGFVQVGLMARADRYTYIPLVGLAIMVAWGVRDLAGHSPKGRRAAFLAALSVVAALALATRQQIEYWANPIALYERAIEVTTNNRFAHENLALALADAGREEEAAIHFQEALRIEPRRSRSHFGLAVVNARLGRIEAAIASYQEGLRIQPNKVRAHGELGVLLVETGRADTAVDHLAYAIRVLPEDAEFRVAMGDAMRLLDRHAEALAQYRTALRYAPERLDALLGMVEILTSSSDPALRDPDEAIRLIRARLEETGERDDLLRALAAAHEARGDRDEARRIRQQAVVGRGGSERRR